MSKLLISRWFHMVLLLALLTAAVSMSREHYKWEKTLTYLAFDAYNQILPRKATDRVVMVNIDDESIARPGLGQWPWSHLVLAKLVDRLKAMEAAAIVFDATFPDPDRTSPQGILDRLPKQDKHPEIVRLLKSMPDNDRIFADSIKKAGNVVTGFIWAEQKTVYTNKEPVLTQQVVMPQELRHDLSDTVWPIIGATADLPLLAKASAGNGCFGAKPDSDGTLRRAPLLFSYKNDAGDTILYPSLALEAARVAQGADTFIKARALKSNEYGWLDSPLRMKVGQYEIPFGYDGGIIVYFAHERSQNYIPAWKVIDGSVDPDRIRNKIVFIGSNSFGLKDMKTTPLDPLVTGTEVNMNVTEQILTGQFLQRPNRIVYGESLLILILGIPIILLAPFVSVISMVFFVSSIIACICALSWHSFVAYGLLFDPIYPSICLSILCVSSVFLSHIRTESERRQVKSAFGHYVSPDLLDELAKNPDKLKLGGETRELTVMFTDIRGFTGIAESMAPEELIQLMNDFLTPMSDLVMSNRGTIDKYMGDAMMAFWNAPLDDPQHARHACAAALKMNRALDPINDNLRLRAQALGKTPLLLKAGIGINSGSTSVGNMGSKQRFAYSAIGDTVNLASRLEGQTRTYNASVIIGEATRKLVPDFAALELDLIQVKGKTEPARIFALVGDDAYATPAEYRKWAAIHAELIAAYRALDFPAAQRLIDECRAQAEPRFKNLYALYQERITEMKDHPPGKNWDGVFVATSKK